MLALIRRGQDSNFIIVIKKVETEKESKKKKKEHVLLVPMIVSDMGLIAKHSTSFITKLLYISSAMPIYITGL